ncbi:putative mannonate dehydrogenase [uncultured Pleomorphomonas sp.]|uniref:Putative mannonate dehydrogenase n=1 Tax=uncultured Pleomorphomonas sp. TaxID=442121 RepID=A0A212LFZ1_9HYPH|nr:mannitol dehydrogenase family protein [uncultured Pleomorphomonas sp.]SCM76486.1 putative mannonate dehydrogenase [uncultured Pleomorphomonas sp.]
MSDLSQGSAADGTAPRLSERVLAGLPAAVARPAYDRRAVAAGIVHLGLGAFCRGHLGVYTDDVLAAGATDWGIVGVDLMSPDIRAALKPQDCLYTLINRVDGVDRLRVVGSFLDVMATSDQLEEVLAVMCRPEIRVVTITVTEKGYCHDPATGRLNEAHPAVIADLAAPEAPKTLPGLVVEAIRRRRAAGVKPFTVLSCDNLAQNGVVASRVVTRFAELRDPELGAWIAGNIAFPCSMVDRITPATRDAERAAVLKGLGVADAWPVVSEPFRQWAIEDNFPSGRPAWETVGATLTDVVVPFETMKLRCLNGTHSTLAYLSVLAGIETVADAMADPHLPQVIRKLWDEDIIATVPPVPDTDVVAYTHALEARYRNPEIRHLTIQISSDGSQKLGPRLLEPAAERIAAGHEVKVVPLAVAAWMAFLLEGDGKGRTWKVADPMADRLTSLARANAGSAEQLADALLAVSEIFPAEVAGNAAFRAAVVEHLDSLLSRGVRATLAAFVAA